MMPLNSTMIEKSNDYIRSKGNNAVDPSELNDLAIDERMSKKQMEQILSYLIDNGNIHFLQQKYLHSDLVHKAKEILLEQLAKTTEGIKVSQLRDLLNTNRGTAMILLEFFDSENITLRKGNFRVLTNKYKDKMNKM